jgi:hypothetical protein
MSHSGIVGARISEEHAASILKVEEEGIANLEVWVRSFFITLAPVYKTVALYPEDSIIFIFYRYIFA